MFDGYTTHIAVHTLHVLVGGPLSPTLLATTTAYPAAILTFATRKAQAALDAGHNHCSYVMITTLYVIPVQLKLFQVINRFSGDS
jgi:hypothetical protein